MVCRNLCDKLYSTKIIAQGESVIPQKYREMMALATAAALKCPYCQTFHRESAKMYGASEAELNELATVVAQTSFWSTILHIQN